MATYIGTTQARPRVSRIWFAVVAFAVAAAIVVAIAMQGGSVAGYSGSFGSSSTDTQHTQSRLIDPPVSGGSGQTLTTPHRF